MKFEINPVSYVPSMYRSGALVPVPTILLRVLWEEERVGTV